MQPPATPQQAAIPSAQASISVKPVGAAPFSKIGAHGASDVARPTKEDLTAALKTRIALLLTEFLQRQGIGRDRCAAMLCIKSQKVTWWRSQKRLPNKADTVKLDTFFNAGGELVAALAAVNALRPPPKYRISQARIFTLAEYASMADKKNHLGEKRHESR